MRQKVKGITFIIFMVAFAFAPFAFATEDEAINDIPKEEITEDNTTTKDLKSKRKETEEKIKDLKEKKGKDLEKAKEKVLENVRESALKAIDGAVKKLTKIKERVAKMKVTSDDQKTELNAKIDARIAVLESKEGAVKAATTVEEVKTVLSESKKEIRNTKDIVKSVVDAIHKTHLTNIVARIETLLTKLETKAGNLEDTKKDETIVLINDARASLEAAKADIESGEFKFAKEDIKEAHGSIVKILKNINTEKDGDGEGGDDD